MIKFHVTRLGLALGVAAVVAFSGPARADTVLCQKKLSKATWLVTQKMIKKLQKAADRLRKGPINYALAPKVDKDLSKIYDTSKGAVAKFRSQVDALYTTGTPSKKQPCDDNALTGLGFLLSGGLPNGAPGANGIKFTEDVLLVQAEAKAYDVVMEAAPLFANQLQQMQQVAGCPGGSACAGSPCSWLCNQKSECSERSCNMGLLGVGASPTYTTSWNLGTPGSPFTLSSTLTNVSALNMCFMDGNILGTEDNFMYVTGSTGRTLDVLNLGSGIYVCIDTLRMAGYCDCGAAANKAFKDYTDCMDRDIYRNGCTDGILSTGTDDCGSDCSAGQADPNYPGDYNGLPKLTFSTGTTAGDCVVQVTNQFTVITNAIIGGDGQPCTPDDQGGVNSPTTVVLTTGTARAKIINSVTKGSYGTCDADGSTPCVGRCYNPCINFGTGKFCNMLDSASQSVACKKDVDCPTGCTGTGYDPTTQTGDSGIAPVMSGAKPSIGSFPYAVSNICDLYRQDHLTGLILGGAFPGSSSDQNGGLGDNISAFQEICY
jgi:hypothetical protein